MSRGDAGTKLGLALGGGGARAFAHLGVIEVLEHAGYTIDYVAGSSSGAIVAWLVASGLRGSALSAALEELLDPAVMQPLFRPGLKDAAGRHGAFFERATRGATFSGLQIPLTVLSVDLVSQRPVAHRYGPVSHALIASTALPGFVPPVQRGAQRLVDGIVLEAVPATAVAEAGADLVVAIDLLGGDPVPPPLPDEGEPSISRDGSALAALFDSIELLYRQASIRSAAHADVVIAPRFGPVTWRDFAHAQAAVEAGRTAAQQHLGDLEALARADSRTSR